MNTNKINHQPKGSMCAACKHKMRDCSKLPFSDMPVRLKYDGVKIFKCKEFKRGVN